MKRLLCWIFFHRFSAKQTSPNGELIKVRCDRCGRRYAIFHPQRYFGEWDSEDDEMWEILNMEAKP